jgi:poly-beta-1,6-N-acetyl-D-glucosamine synthase
MTTLPKLWHQRLRWQRGALENLRDWTRVRARYFLQQFMMGFGALSFAVYLAFMALALSAYSWPPVAVPLAVRGSVGEAVDLVPLSHPRSSRASGRRRCAHRA